MPLWEFQWALIAAGQPLKGPCKMCGPVRLPLPAHLSSALHHPCTANLPSCSHDSYYANINNSGHHKLKAALATVPSPPLAVLTNLVNLRKAQPLFGNLRRSLYVQHVLQLSL